MRLRTVGLALLPIAVVVSVVACGQQSTTQSPALSQLPLVDGARIVTNVRECDKGANAFCAIELVVVGPRYKSSVDLVKAQRARLKGSGWTGVAPDDGQQRAAESPGQKLRITYATAAADLLGIDLEWIKRPHPITLALANAMFARSPAMSILLEAGPA
jgi:hypothetical protein